MINIGRSAVPIGYGTPSRYGSGCRLTGGGFSFARSASGSGSGASRSSRVKVIPQPVTRPFVLRQIKWRRTKRQQGNADLVTAWEIACFVYYPEQFRLQYGLGQDPARRAALDAGTRHHGLPVADGQKTAVRRNPLSDLAFRQSLGWLVGLVEGRFGSISQTSRRYSGLSVGNCPSATARPYRATTRRAGGDRPRFDPPPAPRRA